ncbi:MAG: cupin domain-containing protein [Bryobacteraceae bacterium]
MKHALWLLALAALAAERQVDPTFLRRNPARVAEKPADITTLTCGYKPLFGAGDPDARMLRGIARYGEARVAGGGTCEAVSYPAEEQIYYVLEGSGVLLHGAEQTPVRAGDFLYLGPGLRHAMSNPGASPCRFLIMGFRVPAGSTAPARLPIANIADVPLQTVGNHPPSTQYRLMIGDRSSTRDKLAAGLTVTSLFIMEFAPGGTNFPHHHEREEEIYILLDGEGDMVAGGGMDGVEGRHPAKPGDTYFFRLNCTVGFYNGKTPGRILAVRSLFPFPRK